MVIITIDGYTMIKRRERGRGGEGVRSKKRNGSGSDLGAYPYVLCCWELGAVLGLLSICFIACIAFPLQIFRGFIARESCALVIWRSSQSWRARCFAVLLFGLWLEWVR